MNPDTFMPWLEGHGRPADHYELLGLPKYSGETHALRDAASSAYKRLKTYQNAKGVVPGRLRELLGQLAEAIQTDFHDEAARQKYDEALRARPPARAVNQKLRSATATKVTARPTGTSGADPVAQTANSQGAHDAAATAALAVPSSETVAIRSPSVTGKSSHAGKTAVRKSSTVGLPPVSPTVTWAPAPTLPPGYPLAAEPSDRKSPGVPSELLGERNVADGNAASLHSTAPPESSTDPVEGWDRQGIKLLLLVFGVTTTIVVIIGLICWSLMQLARNSKLKATGAVARTHQGTSLALNAVSPPAVGRSLLPRGFCVRAHSQES